VRTPYMEKAYPYRVMAKVKK